jgi:hypothetical protein
MILRLATLDENGPLPLGGEGLEFLHLLAL